MNLNAYLSKNTSGVRFSLVTLYVSSFVIFVASFLMWWNYVYMRDTSVFWGAVDNALATNGVTKTKITEQDDYAQTERVSLTFTPELHAAAFSSTTTPSQEVTESESIATRNVDYARYTKLPQSGTDNNSITNVWVNTTDQSTQESALLSNQLSDGLFVFAAHLPHATRTSFVSSLREKDVFSVISKVRDDTIQGTKVAVYGIAVDVSAYNRAVADYFRLLGLPEAALQVTQNTDTTRQTFEIAINPLSRTIIRTGYPTLADGSVLHYSQWGVRRTYTIPDTSVSREEFLRRLDAVRTKSTEGS